MNSILWIQSDALGGSDHYYVDGKIVDSKNGPLKEKANAILVRAQESKSVRINDMKRYREILQSPNFTVAISITGELLYKSIFNERANDGRLQSFVFWCTKTEIYHFWDILKICSSSHGYTLRDQEQKVVYDYLCRVNKRRITSLLAILCVITFSIITYAVTKS